MLDTQFAWGEDDNRLCKRLDKGVRKQRSKYVELYRRKGKGKGKPAVGGKGQYILQERSEFNSTVLRVSADGTWHCCGGTCISLAHLFAKLGRNYTAARLYEYYNLCRPLASKRPHAWSNPWRQQAALERY